MQRSAVLFSISLFLVAGLAGCATAPPDEPKPAPAAAVAFATDPAGDAMMGSTALVRSAMGKCMVVPSGGRDGCRQAVNTVRGAVPTAGGRPAPDALDVVGASLQESPEALVVAIDLASVQADFADAVAGDGSTGASWDVCWIVGGDEEKGWECAYLFVRASEGKPVVEAYYDRYSPDCNDWWWCSWHVDTVIQAGNPGKISFTVPRFVLGAGAAGDVLGKPVAGTARCTYPSDSVQWFAEGAAQDWGGLYTQACETTDTTDEGGNFTFTTAPAPASPADHALAAFANDSPAPGGRQDLDVLSMQIVETPQGLMASVKMARVDESPMDHVTDFAIGLPTRHVYEGGYDMRDGTMTPWGGYCKDADCKDWVDLMPTVTRVAGAPGWINLTFARSDLQAPKAGDLVNLAYFAISPVTMAQPGVPGVLDLTVRTVGRGDWTQTLPPQFLALDTE